MLSPLGNKLLNRVFPNLTFDIKVVKCFPQVYLSCTDSVMKSILNSAVLPRRIIQWKFDRNILLPDWQCFDMRNENYQYQHEMYEDEWNARQVNKDNRWNVLNEDVILTDLEKYKLEVNWETIDVYTSWKMNSNLNIED